MTKLLKKIIGHTLSYNKDEIDAINNDCKDSKTIHVVECEDGDDFQDYMYATRERVPSGTQVGYEMFDDKEKVWELVLFNDIFFQD